MAETTPATRGWLHNQVGIRVSDLAKSTFFYETILGMQVLAHIESDSLALVLMGYPEGGGPEKMLSREGVLELSYSEVLRHLVYPRTRLYSTAQKTHVR